MTNSDSLTIQALWNAVNFQPNENQKQAILLTNNPLFLTAGPGSGKTRVLLWRTVNLIVFHDTKPEEIFLSTFTEKAARQLQEGLRSLLALVTSRTGQPYDISKMYVGTVHSLCQKVITDRRFSAGRERQVTPVVLDELSQYLYLYKSQNWQNLIEYVGLDNNSINNFFDSKSSESKHKAVESCISLFNRFSEERIDPEQATRKTADNTLKQLLQMYQKYLETLSPINGQAQVDFSQLQQKALETIESFEGSKNVFKYIIIDEYQDTNSIQEKLFFKLAAGCKNICVVGDDDQALYRFRGATVENFVEFPHRCQKYLTLEPQKIPLNINYRSRREIVKFYTDFISRCNWKKEGDPTNSYRLDKHIQSHNQDSHRSVIASKPASPETSCLEIAKFVNRLIETKKVEDPNQIAFLFPSLKSPQVQRMKDALEKEGLRVYAPRAGRFLELEEAVSIFGLYLAIFGKPERKNFPGKDYNDYHKWMDDCLSCAQHLLEQDEALNKYVKKHKEEISRVIQDYQILENFVKSKGWSNETLYNPKTMATTLRKAGGLSSQAQNSLDNLSFYKQAEQRFNNGNPYHIGDVINRVTQLKWNILDLFWEITGFKHFRKMFDLAERGKDEGPICNLGLITQYLARYMDTYGSFLTARFLDSGGFRNLFLSSYLYTLFRRDESEYEDSEDPFPKGRIPFLTVHQAKGLEFPVVVLGNLRKDDKGPQTIEKIVRPLLERQGEPLERQTEFDIMRMFYVALSRAKNLLVLAHFQGRGQRINEPFKSMLNNNFPRITEFDLSTMPAATLEEEETPRNYSYTSDYLLYQECPRQYMIFRKYGFAASQTETLMFGSLVHQTIEDLHNYLISRKQQP